MHRLVPKKSQAVSGHDAPSRRTMELACLAFMFLVLALLMLTWLQRLVLAMHAAHVLGLLALGSGLAGACRCTGKLRSRCSCLLAIGIGVPCLLAAMPFGPLHVVVMLGLVPLSCILLGPGWGLVGILLSYVEFTSVLLIGGEGPEMAGKLEKLPWFFLLISVVYFSFVMIFLIANARRWGKGEAPARRHSYMVASAKKTIGGGARHLPKLGPRHVRVPAPFSVSLDWLLSDTNSEIHFQPVCTADGHRVVWYEALLRVRGVHGLLESAQTYLKSVEIAGLMPRLTRKVLRAALEFSDGHGAPVAVNLSLPDIQDPGIRDLIIFEARKRKPGMLILEVVECVDLSTVALAEAYFTQARAAGCLVALDDFGTGYANLTALFSPVLDILKIDGSFIARCLDDCQVHSLVRGVVEYCKSSGIVVVAEHIETAEQAEHFRKMGCDFLQGYLMGMPLPRSEINSEAFVVPQY